MHFIWFLIRLALADLVAVIVMAIGTFIVSLPVLLLVKIESKINSSAYKGLSYICAIPMLIFMLVSWGFWAAYNVGITYLFANSNFWHIQMGLLGYKPYNLFNIFVMVGV